jgi:hypothetical protein
MIEYVPETILDVDTLTKTKARLYPLLSGDELATCSTWYPSFIDNAITLLPPSASKYCSYWPSLLTLL